MKVIDAYWEKENIGLRTHEVFFDANDRLLDLDLAETESNSEHVVLKIPSTRLDIIHHFETTGYRFVEQQFEISKRLRKNEIPPSVHKFATDFSYEEIDTGAELGIILNEIKKGVFDTDRIFLDPLMGKEYSSHRYENWLQTLFRDSKNKIALIKDADQNFIGFNCINIADPKVCHGVLGSIFQEYKNSGLGILFIYFAMISAIDKGYKRFHTAISSNNIGVMNLYQLLSFQINTSHVVLRKIFK